MSDRSSGSGPAASDTSRSSTEPLGSATSLRFAQLIVLVVAGTAALSGQVAFDLATRVRGEVGDSVGCALAGGLDPEVGLYVGSISDVGPAYPGIQACWAKYVPDTAWVPYAAVALVLLGAALLYLVTPRWKARGSRLTDVAVPDADGSLRRDLARFVREAGLEQGRVRFGVAADALTSEAVVFGTRRRAVVRLNAGLLITREKDAERFRAVVMHELAHVRNRDVAITSATVALWRVFLAVAFVPALADAGLQFAAVREPSSWHIAAIDVYVLAECAVITLTVHLARADILRAREHYADLTAAAWWRVRPVEFDEADTPAARTALGRAARRIARGRTVHPTWPERRRVLEKDRLPDTVRALPVLATGLVLDLAFSMLSGNIFSLTNAQDIIRLLLFAGAIAATVGLTLWRAVARGCGGPFSAPSGWRTGFWLGCGMAAGELLHDGTYGGQWLPPHPEAFAILVGIVMVLMAWTAEYARACVGGHPRAGLRIQALVGLVPLWLVLTFLLQEWEILPEYGWLWSSAAEYAALGVPAAHPPALLRFDAVLAYLPGDDTTVSTLWWTVSLLWLLPLAQRVRQRIGVGGASAAAASPGDRTSGDGFPGLRAPVLAGLFGAAACVSGILFARTAITSTHAMGTTVQTAAYGSWMVVVVTGGMALAAMALAVLTRGDYPLLGMLTASGVVVLVALAAGFVQGATGGCLGAVNALPADRCTLRPGLSASLIRDWLGFAYGPGLLMSMLVGSAAYAARCLIRRARRTTRDRQALARPARSRGRAWPVGAMTVVVALVIGGETTYATTHPAPATSDPTTASVFEPARTPSPLTEQMQVEAWVKYGGLDLVKQLVTLDGGFPKALGQLTDASGTAPRPAAAAMVASCDSLLGLAGGAGNGLPVPLAGGQAIWARVTDALDDAADACRRFDRSHETASFLAAFDDLNDAERESEVLVSWIGPVGSTPGTTPIVAQLGDSQPFSYDSVTYKFTAANLTIEPADATATHVHPGDRVATVDVEACVADLPSHVQLYGKLGITAWRLVLPDGTAVSPTTSWTGRDFDATQFVDSGVDDFTAPGDCSAGLVGFDIPAGERGTPTQVLFASKVSPDILAWSIPSGGSAPSPILGTAEEAGPASGGWITVGAYAARRAGANHEGLAEGDRIATVAVQQCGLHVPPTDPAAWAGWDLLLADGTSAEPVGTWSQADFRSPLFPGGRASIGSAGQCRTGIIAFGVPAADRADPVEIDDHTALGRFVWFMSPPAQ